MSAVPSIGRASRVDRPGAPGAEAATELYERYSAQVFGYCFHQLGSREEAEDAVQTTFMNAFRGLARGIVPEAEQAWVFKIAHNVCLSRRRSSWRRGRVEAPNNMEVLQEVVPAKDKVADELIRLQDVLEAMPGNQRRAILLREWQGLSYREIAAELNLSQAAVETLIFRARRALASGLEDAPFERGWRQRVRRGADVGGAVAFLKTLLGGGGASAAKVVTVVALTGATVAATTADRLHPHRSAAETKTVAEATTTAATRDSSLSTAAAAASVVALRRDLAPRPRRARPPRATRQSEATRPPAGSPPAPTPSQPARVTATQTAASSTEDASGPSHVKSPKSHGRPADAGRPAPAPAVESGPGNDTGTQKDRPVAPQPAPAPPAASASTSAPGASADHGPDAAPGQETKADDNGAHGNGRGK